MLTAAAPHDLLTGVWGGDRATLTLDQTGGTLIEDCQVATLTGPVHLRKNGRFTAVAQREVYEGGPQQADIPPIFVTIRLAGRIEASSLSLDVSAPGAPAQRLTLVSGRRIKAIPCL